MTLQRTPLTFADAMTRVAGVLTFDDARRIVRRSDRCVRNWSEPGSAKRPTVDQALALDVAYRAAGGDGAPFLEAFAFQLDVQVERQTADRRDLTGEIATVAREAGEAIAASLAITTTNASPRETHFAFVQAQQAHVSFGALLRRLTSFLPVAVGAGAGKDRGTP